MSAFLTFVILISCFQIAFCGYGVTYYVSTNGKDSNPGTESEPWQTLNHARDVIRNYKHTGNHTLPVGGVLVYIRSGTYNQLNYSEYNVPVLDLSSQDDSGTENAPIVWTSYPGETVEIFGGYQIPSNAFTVSSMYPSLLVANLSKINSILWDNINYGNLASGGLGTCANGRSELFVNGKRMILARWPNIYTQSNYPNLSIWNWTNIVKVINANSFTYNFSNERASKWAKEVSESTPKNSPWVHGYWSFGWADSYTQIQSIDQSANEINTYSSTPPVYGYKANARFYGVNLLSELDTINEYYFDISNKLVYINKMRESTLSNDKYYISVNPTVINIQGFGLNKYKWGRRDFWNEEKYWSQYAKPPGNIKEKYKYAKPPSWPIPGLQASSIQYITISNLTIGYATQTGLSATDISYSNFNNLNIFGIGETGFIATGYNNNVINNSVNYIGCHGMNIEGGDYYQLINGNNLIFGNHAQYYAQWKRTYQPGIAFGGVGNQYINNYVGYAPHEGMTGGGNDLLFDSNTFEMLCYEVSDSGAWYAGRSWTHRGSILNNNTFINIRNVEKTYLGSPSVQGIYLDDQLSGHNITNNEFINCQAGILVGGGRRNEVHNNKFASCSTSVLYDDRGLTWQKSFCEPGGEFNQQLNQVNYTNPPWSIHYPYLPNIYKQQPCTPVFDHITNNQYCCGKSNNCKFIDDTTQTCLNWNSTCNSNTQTSWSNQYC